MHFEDMFLYDGLKQLKLRFNPKVSSFKTTILESKLDTLGNKYPFFFRNGNTYYKEFPISALLSMQSDDNEFFLEWKNTLTDLRGGENISINESYNNLTTSNIKKERDFKMAALEWLNNG
jgi:hypothetical protein